METLYCYTRVSTKGQATEGNSLDVQKNHGEQVADKLGMKFKLVSEGGRSSTIHIRYKLEELKERIKEGKVKHLWVLDRSRLYRNNTQSQLFRRDYLVKFGVNFYEGTNGELTNLSFPEIGEAFNGRDHTTVLHACKKIAELRKENASQEEDYRNLNRALTN